LVKGRRRASGVSRAFQSRDRGVVSKRKVHAAEKIKWMWQSRANPQSGRNRQLKLLLREEATTKRDYSTSDGTTEASMDVACRTLQRTLGSWNADQSGSELRGRRVGVERKTT